MLRLKFGWDLKAGFWPKFCDLNFFNILKIDFYRLIKIFEITKKASHMKQGRGREGDLASHEHFHFHLNGIGIKESCVVGFHISHFITISKWAESAFWWFSSLLLWGNFFCCVCSVIFCLGVPPRWRDSQSCSLWAQAQQQPLYRPLACAIQRRAHPRPHAQEEERDQSTLTESHLQMSNPLSWTRRFSLPRKTS